jgi:hypothetical protein
MFPNPQYVGLVANPATIRTTIDYQQRTGQSPYVFGPVYHQNERQTFRRRRSPRRHSPRRKSPIKYESAYTPYSLPMEVTANQYVPQSYRDWPYTRPRLPFRYWTNRWNPMYGMMPSELGTLVSDPLQDLPYFTGYSATDSCVMKIYLEEAFQGDILEAGRQQWLDWAKNNGFIAVAFPNDKNITDHVFVLFDGVCPVNMQSSYLPEKFYHIEWVRF